ncbi:MAG: hypothetical protein H7Y88_11320 [Phycisphaerales bacterium]|nr:hypothetical protein [Phycisphaerales bacterium]
MHAGIAILAVVRIPLSGLGVMTWVALVLAMVGSAVVVYVGLRLLESRGRGSRSGADEATTLASDLRQLSERFAVEAEGRIVRLEALLERADERLNELNRIEKRVSNVAKQAGPVPASMVRSVAAPTTTPPHDATARRVYALADQGSTVVQIAREVGQHAGQVELILALRRASDVP